MSQALARPLCHPVMMAGNKLCKRCPLMMEVTHKILEMATIFHNVEIGMWQLSLQRMRTVHRHLHSPLGSSCISPTEALACGYLDSEETKMVHAWSDSILRQPIPCYAKHQSTAFWHRRPYDLYCKNSLGCAGPGSETLSSKQIPMARARCCWIKQEVA